MLSTVKGQVEPRKLLLIASSLAKTRPSFMAYARDLTREDLLFMEKYFQRALIEFIDFIEHCGALKIICRRSGEVAAVNKAFVALTGWTKAVLLGKEANRNCNVRVISYSSSSDGETGSHGVNTIMHRPESAILEPNGFRRQPVFLAELMDDDGLVQFYHDFSRYAFRDSRGSTRRIYSLIQ